MTELANRIQQLDPATLAALRIALIVAAAAVVSALLRWGIRVFRSRVTLRLPDAAFSYLRSHGMLDREHTATFELLMDRIDDAGDQAAIVHAARVFYGLYGEVFRGLPLPQPEARPVVEAA